MLWSTLFLLTFCVLNATALGFGSGNNGNLRVCVVEGRGLYKRASKYCPVLDEEGSGIECVIGTDRLDCLRRMSKGKVDFGVFSPEDLIAAQWADLDVLVTNELRTKQRPFERSIVAVVNRRILPEQHTPVSAILRNTTFCHPGIGGDDERGLSDTLAEYLESLIMDRSCSTNLTHTENRIQTLANFFGKSCKPGSWVPEKSRDSELKTRYPSLCAACSSTCTKQDMYWGDVGALNCLSHTGDFTWSQLDTVKSYFGLLPTSTQYANPADFAFLCRDGSWQSLVNNTDPCVWLNRPWPVVVAKRKSSEAVSNLAESLTNKSIQFDPHWHGALASLLEVYRAQPDPLRPQASPLDYLSRAKGFREAYSQSGCSPPRHITLCTVSILEKHKCEWLSEAGAVYGVTPPLQCEYRARREDCFQCVHDGVCDTTIGDSDWLVRAQRDYNVTILLHELTPIVNELNIIDAYVRNDSSYKSLTDLRGKRAAFPYYDGFAWHAVQQHLSKDKNHCNDVLGGYFSEICAPGIEKYNFSKGIVERYSGNCYMQDGLALDGERHAMRALIEGRVDVAFVSMATYKEYTGTYIPEPWAKENTITPLCPTENKAFCFISWSSLGHVYASKTLTQMRKQEIINVFTKLDRLFGKNSPFHTAMFSMYGPFNHQLDVLFHNNTRILATNAVLRTHPFDKIPLSFERGLGNFSFDSCKDYLRSSGLVSSVSLCLVLFSSLLVWL